MSTHDNDTTPPTNPDQAPYPHLEDYRKMVRFRQGRIAIPKNPNIRYRPSTWHVKKATGYTKTIRFEDLEDTQKHIAEYYNFVACEILTLKPL